MSVSRREFLESAVLTGLTTKTAAGAAAPGSMPTRILGRTGIRVSVLGFGCGSRFLSYKEVDKASEALTRALDSGVTYVDTATSYGDGVSEEWVGQIVKSRRKEITLVTKVNLRGGDEAMRLIEGSLKRLQTDHLDLLHVHGLGDEEDLKKIEAKEGVLAVLYKLREQRVARFIGVTCHDNPHVLSVALERNDFDCTQMALNAARVGAGKAVHDPWSECFETVALPVALRKNLGVTAMKIFGQDRLVGDAPPAQLIRYALSLPVAAAVIGMPQLSHVEQNIGVAKAFTPMPQDEMKQLSHGLADRHKLAMDRYFHAHIDC
jgi:aryl-alcohol dehydrogenase-like predicted oxidoreductase